MRKAFVEQQANFDAARPPEFTGLEEFGRWSTHTKNLMETQDHLCRVANIRTVQFKKLHDAGIKTMTDLAKSSLPSIPKIEARDFRHIEAAGATADRVEGTVAAEVRSHQSTACRLRLDAAAATISAGCLLRHGRISADGRRAGISLRCHHY